MKRRDFLQVAGFGLTVGAANVYLGKSSAKAQIPTPPTLATTPYSANSVTELAKALAAKPYKEPLVALPEPFSSLNYEQYVEIQCKRQAMQFDPSLGFVVEPLHRGFIFTQPVELFTVDNRIATKITYDPSQFDFGKLKPAAPNAELGFSGIRVLWSRGTEGLTDIALFQGASFFRAVAAGQTPGQVSRTLAIQTADPRGEEFPIFRALWIEKPNLADNILVIHALLDSPSVAGACQFTLRPGDTTIVDVELALFARVNIDHIGFGAMNASFLYGPILHPRGDELRPGVYEVNGLQMLTGNGEWIWRPVSNRQTLQISAFSDDNPKGFGLLQRERSLESFQDDVSHWERRPSLWIEPLGDWGQGAMTLIEIPSESEINDNIIAYWRPKAPLLAESEFSIAYRQFWSWHPNARPPLAQVIHSRAGAANQPYNRRFIVEFIGDIFADGAIIGTIKPNLTASLGTIETVRTYWLQENKIFRVVFELNYGSETMSEIRLVLESEAKAISETWLYRWTN